MAFKLIDVWRPHVQTKLSAGPGAMADADWLVARIDLEDDGRRVRNQELLFSDYAGLEAEWEAGSATTVLNTSVQAAVDALDDDDEISAAQKSLLATSYTKA